MACSATSRQQAEVIALSKLTCFVLPHEHHNLLQPKSIWNADKERDKCPLVEHILHLDSVEVNIFQGITLPDAPKFGKVFGGQFLGQALAAASKTVDFLKIVHSSHAYFLLVGDLDKRQIKSPMPLPNTVEDMEAIFYDPKDLPRNVAIGPYVLDKAQTASIRHRQS